VRMCKYADVRMKKKDVCMCDMRMKILNDLNNKIAMNDLGNAGIRTSAHQKFAH